MKNNYELNYYNNIKSDVKSGDATTSEIAMIEVVEANLEAAEEWDARDNDFESRDDALDSFQQNAVDTLLDDGIKFDDQAFAWLWKGAQAS
jgi:hypothetical protein